MKNIYDEGHQNIYIPQAKVTTNLHEKMSDEDH